MEITKIFSNNQDNKRLYTVLMNDDELRLYSEFQKEFARRDYEGLTSEQASKLKDYRNQIAKNFQNSRKDIQNSMKKLENSWNSLKPGEGMYVKNGNIRLNIIKDKQSTFKDAVNQASKFNATQDLKEIERIKNLARQDVLKSKAITADTIAKANARNTNNFLNKGLNFAKKHKVGLGIAGVGLATAGTLATAKYLKKRRSELIG